MRLRRKRQWKLRIWLGYRYHWWHQIWFLEEWTKLLVSSSLRSICFGSSINQHLPTCNPWLVRHAAALDAPQAAMEALLLAQITFCLMTPEQLCLVVQNEVVISWNVQVFVALCISIFFKSWSLLFVCVLVSICMCNACLLRPPVAMQALMDDAAQLTQTAHNAGNIPSGNLVVFDVAVSCCWNSLSLSEEGPCSWPRRSTEARYQALDICLWLAGQQLDWFIYFSVSTEFWVKLLLRPPDAFMDRLDDSGASIVIWCLNCWMSWIHEEMSWCHGSPGWWNKPPRSKGWTSTLKDTRSWGIQTSLSWRWPRISAKWILVSINGCRSVILSFLLWHPQCCHVVHTTFLELLPWIAGKHFISCIDNMVSGSVMLQTSHLRSFTTYPPVELGEDRMPINVLCVQAFYVQKTIYKMDNIKVDKSGGSTVNWNRHGGLKEAWKVAKQLAGWWNITPEADPHGWIGVTFSQQEKIGILLCWEHWQGLWF